MIFINSSNNKEPESMQTERSISEEAWGGGGQDRSYATYLIHSEIILLTFSPLYRPLDSNTA